MVSIKEGNSEITISATTQEILDALEITRLTTEMLDTGSQLFKSYEGKFGIFWVQGLGSAYLVQHKSTVLEALRAGKQCGWKPRH